MKMVKVAIFRVVVGIGGMAIVMVGCSTAQPQAQNSSEPTATITATPSAVPTVTPNPTKSATLKDETPQSELPLKSSPDPTTSAMTTPSSSATVPIAVYHMDGDCSVLVPKTENLPKEKTLEAAVGSVIRRYNSADFTVSDYRVSQTGSKATIVLRLPPTAKRPFAAMSSCEQMALFGALRATIVGKSDWNIKDIEFSDGKKEILF